MEIKIKIPKEVNKAIHMLQNNNYSAYVVGGAVRDSILNRTVHDWDICTSATPSQMIEIFKKYKIVEIGLQHGTITVIINDMPIEITTFRIDGNYSDNRKPDFVTFTNKLIEDLKRRDFTINAMAYNDEEGLIDPFDGLYDIEHRILRCVGVPEKRFSEDALRILRLWRFSVQLGFYPTEETEQAARRLLNSLENISMERIQSEFVKALQGNKFNFVNQRFWYLEAIIPEFIYLFNFKQDNPYHIYDVYIHSVKAYEYLNNSSDLTTKIATLLHDFGKPFCFQVDENNIKHFNGHCRCGANMIDNIMKRLKFDNETRNDVVELIYYHDATIMVGKKYIKRWLNKIGEKQFRRLLELKKADICAQNPKFVFSRLNDIYKIEDLLNSIIYSDECFSLKDLAVNGNDVKKYMRLKEGKEIGFWLNKMLKLVINGEVDNTRDNLIYWMSSISDDWVCE